MTRPTRWKIFYPIALLAVSFVALAILYAGEYEPSLIIVLAILFVIPGRINGHYWRDFYTGRKMMDSERYEDARREFEKFLTKVRKKPRLKSLIWFVWGVYTRDVEAMTHNNTGTALIFEGDLNSAEDRLKQAILVDAKYPIPYYNLAVIAELRGDRSTAIQSLTRAKELGYRNTSIDKVVNQAGGILAALESRKKTTSGTG